MKTVKLSRKDAIAAFCVECNCRDAAGVIDCVSDGIRATKCFLYDLRPKKRPDRIRGEWFDKFGSRKNSPVPLVISRVPMSEEQREEAAKRLSRAREKKND